MKFSSWSTTTRVILLSCILASVVVSLGAFTRLVDAGLGCPDWPGCYGHILWPETDQEIQSAQQAFPDAPVDTDKTWPEMVHRYFATALGFVILCVAIYSLKHHRESRIPVKLPIALLALVIIQGVFGMWTVTLKLWPQVVTTHLLGGFSTLSLLWLLFLRLHSRDLGQGTVIVPLGALARLRSMAIIGLVVVICQIALGGWTTSNYAALACVDFPTCHGEWLPPADFVEGFNFTQAIGPNYLGGVMDNDARTAIHWSHRVGALLVSVVLLILCFSLWRTGAGSLKRLAVLTLAILTTQVTLGITNVVEVLPLTVAVAHNGVGALLLMALVTINHRLFVYTGEEVSASSAQALPTR